jgi:two-component system CheB/CheR fusion protein
MLVAHPTRETESATGLGIVDSGPWVREDELRDSLTVILSVLETIPDGRGGDPATRRARMIVKRQARRAVRILEDLFNVRAGSPGAPALHKEVVDLAEIVAGATEAVGHLLDSRGHRLIVTLPPEPVPLLVDPLRLERVLTNLLINAATSTNPGGHIWLTAGTGAGQLVVLVRDNGRGIARDLLPRVFDPFPRGGASQKNDPGGPGIGLALVKSLVELHGGSIAAVSNGPGLGSEFIVRLPVCVRGV